MIKNSIFGLIVAALMLAPAMADTNVSIPTGISGTSGMPVHVPVNMSGVQDLFSFNLYVTYDHTKLSISPSNVALGSLLPSGWSVSPTVDPPSKTVGLYLGGFSGTTFTGGPGQLLDLVFDVLPGASGTIPVTIGPDPYTGDPGGGVPNYGLNDGAIPMTSTDGSVNVQVPEPAAIGLLLGALAGVPMIAIRARRKS
jgi:hypothetical protein